MGESNRIVVVGSGPAGAAAALFASRVPGVEVLVLEAGAASAELGFTIRMSGFTLAKRRPALKRREDLTITGDPGTVLYEELAPGGLSNHWSCAVPRFSSDDFEDAARSGEEYTWPIGYADLAPWYDRVEPLLCIAAGRASVPQLPAGRMTAERRLGRDWSAVVDAAQRTGRSIVPMPYAYGGSTFFTRSGTSFNAYTRLLAPAARKGELGFRGDTPVRKLEWSAQERRVVAVLCADSEGREVRIPCRAVILAAGAVNTAQILLQSTSSDLPRGIGNEHGIVGRYLHDHPLGQLVVDLGRDVSVHRPVYITRPTLDRSPPLLAAAFMQWMGTATLARSILAGRPGRAKQLGFSVFGTMVPRSDDYIAIEGDPPRDTHRTRLAVSLRHPPEVGTLLEQARRDLMTVLEQAGWEPRERTWRIEKPGTSVHYGGTCRMHASPRFGVVDGWCRVHGVPSVAIADSSVFTTTPEKNPVLTAMVLAARTGDHVARTIDGN